jgi:hypothetical protein
MWTLVRVAWRQAMRQAPQSGKRLARIRFALRQTEQLLEVKAKYPRDAPHHFQTELRLAHLASKRRLGYSDLIREPLPGPLAQCGFGSALQIDMKGPSPSSRAGQERPSSGSECKPAVRFMRSCSSLEVRWRLPSDPLSHGLLRRHQARPLGFGGQLADWFPGEHTKLEPPRDNSYEPQRLPAIHSTWFRHLRAPRPFA